MTARTLKTEKLNRAIALQVQSFAPQKEYVFGVKGLKCQACCARLKRHILEHGGVKSCNVDFEKAEVTVRGITLQESMLTALVGQLGYEARLKAASDTTILRQTQVAQSTESQN